MKMQAHTGHRQRVRARFIEEGLSSFEDHQILELLLFYCIPMKDTNELAHKMINSFGSLSRLFEAAPAEIQDRCDVTEATAVLISMIPPLARRYFHSRWNNNTIMNSSEVTGAYGVTIFTGRTNEAVYLLCLDQRLRLIQTELISEGTINESPVYIREIVKATLRHNATRIILIHNHPGGTNRPSISDIDVTKLVIKACLPISIVVIDHVIVAGDQYFSFADRTLLGMRYE